MQVKLCIVQIYLLTKSIFNILSNLSLGMPNISLKLISKRNIFVII